MACPVCNGSGKLLDQVCPLCDGVVEASEDEEPEANFTPTDKEPEAKFTPTDKAAENHQQAEEEDWQTVTPKARGKKKLPKNSEVAETKEKDKNASHGSPLPSEATSDSNLSPSISLKSMLLRRAAVGTSSLSKKKLFMSLPTMGERPNEEEQLKAFKENNSKKHPWFSPPARTAMPGKSPSSSPSIQDAPNTAPLPVASPGTVPMSPSFFDKSSLASPSLKPSAAPLDFREESSVFPSLKLKKDQKPAASVIAPVTSLRPKAKAEIKAQKDAKEGSPPAPLVDALTAAVSKAASFGEEGAEKTSNEAKVLKLENAPWKEKSSEKKAAAKTKESVKEKAPEKKAATVTPPGLELSPSNKTSTETAANQNFKSLASKELAKEKSPEKKAAEVTKKKSPEKKAAEVTKDSPTKQITPIEPKKSLKGTASKQSEGPKVIPPRIPPQQQQTIPPKASVQTPSPAPPTSEDKAASHDKVMSADGPTSKMSPDASAFTFKLSPDASVFVPSSFSMPSAASPGSPPEVTVGPLSAGLRMHGSITGTSVSPSTIPNLQQYSHPSARPSTANVWKLRNDGEWDGYRTVRVLPSHIMLSRRFDEGWTETMPGFEQHQFWVYNFDISVTSTTYSYLDFGLLEWQISSKSETRNVSKLLTAYNTDSIVMSELLGEYSERDIIESSLSPGNYSEEPVGGMMMLGCKKGVRWFGKSRPRQELFWDDINSSSVLHFEVQHRPVMGTDNVSIQVLLRPSPIVFQKHGAKMVTMKKPVFETQIKPSSSCMWIPAITFNTPGDEVAFSWSSVELEQVK